MNPLNFFKKKSDNRELQISTRYTSGIALMKNNRLEEAIVQFHKLLSLDPDHTLAHYHLGEIFYKQREFEQALTCFEKSLKANNGEMEPVDIHIALATSYFALGQLKQAVEEFEKAIDLDPERNELHLDAGELYYRLGKIDEAIAHFEKTSRDDPQVPMYLAKAYWEKEDYEESIRLMKEAVKNFPLNSELHAYLGSLLIDMQMYEKAIEVLLEALEGPKETDENVLSELGDAYYQSGNLEKALEIYNQAIKLFPDNTFFYRRIGFIYKDQDDLDAALRMWRRMVEIDDADLDSRRTLAFGLRLTGEFDTALSEIQHVISLDSTNAFNYISEGNIFFDMGKYENARDSFERAVELGDDFGLFNLAEVYGQIGNSDKATRYANDFIKAAQGNPELEDYIEDATKILSELS